MKKNHIALFIFFLYCTSQALDSASVLWPEDIVYIGAFRLPHTNADSTWRYKKGAIAFYPDGDSSGPADGYTGSIFGGGDQDDECDPIAGMISEINIPVPVNSDVYSELPLATKISGYADITGTLMGCDQGSASPDILGGLCYLPAQGEQTTGKLYWSIYKYYYTMAVKGSSVYDNWGFGWSDVDLSNPNAQGLWHLGTYHAKFTADWIIEIPTAWANAHVDGKKLLGGRSRESGRAYQSSGPPMYAFGPWIDGNPPSDRDSIDAVQIAWFTEESDWFDNPVNTFDLTDRYLDGAWLECAGRSALIIVGYEGVGEYCYETLPETPCNDGCGEWHGSHAYPYEAVLYFYDPDTLAASVNGTIPDSLVLPYLRLRIDSTMLWPVCQTIPEMMTYDRTNNLLYVYQEPAENQPIMHVWRVEDNSTFGSSGQNFSIGITPHFGSSIDFEIGSTIRALDTVIIRNHLGQEQSRHTPSTDTTISISTTGIHLVEIKTKGR